MGWVLRMEVAGVTSSGYLYILTGDEEPTVGRINYIKAQLRRQGWEVVSVATYKVGAR